MIMKRMGFLLAALFRRRAGPAEIDRFRRPRQKSCRARMKANSEERTADSDQLSPVSELAVSGQRSAISDQVVSGQQPAISGQRSTVSGPRLGLR
jgi:hypothetical protein